MPPSDPTHDRAVGDLTPEALPTAMPIREVAQQTGLSESVLRVWEQRYGWPRPGRRANGYRTYPSTLIPVLRAVHEELQHGKAIGDLLRDPYWHAILMAGRLPDAPTANKPRPDWTSIPQPDDPHARRLRTQLEQALERGDRGSIDRIEAEAARLRAQDRDRAVVAVMRYWRELTTAR
jgi:hypothetical protein